ncbi:ATP-dependent DNA helicase MER3 [Kickxella alabastrina]|uniref:ATP-dependent DNA helicase MER3 n=1 Tax=Kickxella alabastrina TaxID=61397 RepID=A0ACC1ITT1_9FUNG|nr:ATP-dependent DNA helicase MER3 [Kickxella alabastrina]
MVISAPTASGKTVLMELAICRLFNRQKQHSQNSSSFIRVRALYLAPLKSLCAEKTIDWQKKFSKCGLQCTKVVGSSDAAASAEEASASDASVFRSHVICATPEKWISVVRGMAAPASMTFLQSIGLVLIDECHMVGTDRGASLEIAVSQVRHYSRDARFVATSATIGNIGDISKWLSGRRHGSSATNAQLESAAKTLVFGEDYRPVRLSKIVLGFACTTPYYKFQRSLDFKLPGIINAHCAGRSVLIFCSTRSSAQETCRHISRNISQLNRQPMPLHLTSEFTNQLLNDTVPLGIAYHHAGLSASDRLRVESLFTSGTIQILCSTSTLGIGVNLPAYAVIVKGTKGYADSDYAEYSTTEIVQFIGRAGRPQFGPAGKAVILTENSMVTMYRNLVSGNDVLESSLDAELPRAILYGVFKREFNSMGDVEEWLENSFMAVCAKRSPSQYGTMGADTACSQIAAKHVGVLVQAGLLVEETQSPLQLHGRLGLSVLGRSVAKYEVDPIRMAQALSAGQLPSSPSRRQIFETVCASGEFGNLKITAGQKGVLNEMNKSPWLRFKLSGRVQTIRDKFGIQCKPVPSGKFAPGLSQDMSRVIKLAYGPAMCIRDCYAERDDAQGVISATVICRELAAKCGEQVPALLQQVDGIGPRYADILWSQNITSISELCKTTARNIEYMVNRNPPFGTRVLASAAALPTCSVDMSSYWMDARSIVFTIKVSCYSDDRPLDEGVKAAAFEKSAKFTIVAHTTDGMLLKFESVEVSTQAAYYETQIGLCNPVPGSRVVVEVAPERFGKL